ncbi:type VI secretion system baseplate subunit TssE [Marinobacter sp. chi1]|uniref:Type VI secretion system baseplate subunit TssE n=1 Tax=Marinobacter suaedae TaxID=3057675 RepID=A0ABT8VW33_9GAMM|nr:type VI secretion system baseplate subunit TssE [Marinobacter sp. chi1]MDO3720179.1 type VI secretion system baseplate subunit TssE [Marinobacter sp. chi1]
MPKKLAAPVLDAILGSQRGIGREALSHSMTIFQIKESLRRNLINLFNTRQCPVSPPLQSRFLTESLLNYGLPDLMSVNLGSTAEARQLSEAIETAVKNYEPRVATVCASINGRPDPLEPEFYFRIEIVLKVALANELIIFDSTLNPITHNFDVLETNDHE